MPHPEPFQIALDDDTIVGTLGPPAEAEPPWPAILMCRTLDDTDDSGLLEDVAGSLQSAGLAVARIEPPATDVDDLVGVARHVFRWLRRRDGIDPLRVGLFGHGRGSLIAAEVAARTGQINRLCLLAPPTPERVKGNGAETGLDVASDVGSPSDEERIPHQGPTLVLYGAADRLVDPHATRPYLDPVLGTGPQSMHEIIALADHSFAAAGVRSVCCTRITRFFAPMATAATAG